MKPNPNLLKRWLLGLALASVAALAGLSAWLQYGYLGGDVRAQVERALTDALQGRATLGSVRADWKADLVFENLAFTVKGRPYEFRVQVPRAVLSLRYVDLLIRKKPIEQCLKSLQLERPVVVMAPAASAPSTQGGEVAEPAPALSLGLPVERVQIHGGSLSVQKEGMALPTVSGMELDGRKEGDNYKLSVFFRPPERSARGWARWTGVIRTLPFEWKGRLQFKEWPFRSLAPILEETAGFKPMGGVLEGDGSLRWREGEKPSYQARVSLSDGSLKIGSAGPLLEGIGAEASASPQGVQLLQAAVFRTGRTEWNLAGAIPFGGAPVSLTAATSHLFLESFTGDLLLLKDLPCAGEGRAAFEVGGTLANPFVKGAASLGAGSVGRWEFQSLDLAAGYSDGRLRVTRAVGSLYDGDFTAYAEISPLLGRDAPIKLSMQARHIRTYPIAQMLGLKDWEGRTDLDVGADGTLGAPNFKVVNDLDLVRSMQGQTFRYHIRTRATLGSGHLSVSTLVNDDARFESEWVDKGDAWELKTLRLNSSRMTNRLKGSGRWPKNPAEPIRIEAQGEKLDVGRLPVIQEQFPDLGGLLAFQLHVSGTREEPKADLQVSSAALRLGKRDPEPFALDATWTPDALVLRKLEWGSLLKAAGSIGLAPESPMDATLEARELPLPFLLGLASPSTSSGGVGGVLTGKLRFLGTRERVLLEGRAAVNGFTAWGMEPSDLSLDLDVSGDRGTVKALRLAQPGGGRLTASGSLTAGKGESLGKLDFRLERFKIRKGLTASLKGSWNGQSAESWFKAGSGSLSLMDLHLEGGASSGEPVDFPNLSADTLWTPTVAQVDVRLGTALTGRLSVNRPPGGLNLTGGVTLAPTPMESLGYLTAYLPPAWKATGLFQGSVTLGSSAPGTLSFGGRFQSANGKLGTYAYDQLNLEVGGEPTRLATRLTLLQGEAQYRLSGTLESPNGFQDPQARLKVEGPFQDETFAHLLSLLGVAGQGHVVKGKVSGNLTAEGTLSKSKILLSAHGKELQFDRTALRQVDLHVGLADGVLTLDKSRLLTDRGEAVLEKASLGPDPAVKGGYHIHLAGSARNLPLALLTLTGRGELDGLLRTQPGPEEDLFTGNVALSEGVTGTSQQDERISAKVSYRDGRLSLVPAASGPKVQGVLDLSKSDRVAFEHVSVEHPNGAFDIDGVLDLRGPVSLSSDARNVRIERVARWFSGDFPVSGTGNYHLLLEGTLDDPLLNASFSLSGGKVLGLSYDLLDGTLISRDNELRVGSAETPLTLSRSGVYAFTLWGTLPFALTPEARGRVRNREMDLTAEMPKGDMGLFLLAGFAKQASGPLGFSARVTGTLDHPQVTADLDFQGGRLVPKIIAGSLEDIQGRIKVRANQVAVEDLNMRIGQGRVFIWTPPADKSRMVLDGFLPRFYDLKIRTVTERGVLLNIPAIMRPGEWGEIQFYGTRREDPMLIVGPSDDPHVVGTALLDSGHYTFPPVLAKSENGEQITYKELADVNFELALQSGRDCWYSNDFNTNYLEMKVNPGDKIYIEGKDSTKGSAKGGIKSRGSAGSRDGWLRYLNREFKIQQAYMHIPRGEMPILQGRATDKIKDVDIITPAGAHKSDVDLWIDFDGPIGQVDFKLDSNPRFAQGNDQEANQQLLLSYVLFGRDMTGLAREDLQKAYEQKVGQQAEEAVLQALDRVAAVEISRRVRRLTRSLGGIEVNLKSGLFQEAARSSGAATASGAGNGTASGTAAEATGNTLLPGVTHSLASVELKKYLDQRLAVVSNFGVLKEDVTSQTTLQKQVGLDYDLSRDLTLNTRVGQNEEGRNEQRVGFSFRTALPDIMRAQKGDKTPPNLERFDVYTLGPGTLQVLWTTDKVSKAELRLLDDGGQLIRTLQGDKGFQYYHEAVIEGLEPDSDYGVQLDVKDLAGNHRTSPVKDVSTPPT